MRVLDLFSGIGGFSLGLERAGMKTVAFCEIDPFCRRVLAKHWPKVPLHDDIRTLKPERGAADLICGGFPCQPFSAAGKRRGTEDDRHLWPEMARVIAEVRPAWVVGENVTGIIGLALDGVLSDLEGMGYAIWPVVLPACAVDAPHRRDRIWIVAHSRRLDSQRGRSECRGSEIAGPRDRPARSGENAVDVAHPSRLQSGWQEQRPIGERVGECGQPIDLADAESDGRQQRRAGADLARKAGWPGGGCRWEFEPNVGRVVDGISYELDLIRGLADELGDSEEAKSAARIAGGRLLRAMWEHQGIATASPDLYRRRLRDCVPGLPHGDPQSRWLLGKRFQEDQGLRDLWQAFCAKPLEEAQNLQRELLERAGAKKRPQALGSRVDRLRSLGNAVVPQIPEIIGRAILATVQP